MPASALSTQRHALTAISENIDTSLVTQGWIDDKPCLVTVDTGGVCDRVHARHCYRMARKAAEPTSWEALPVLKEVYVTLTLGRLPLKVWVFVANITNEFILGLDILHAHDATVDIGRRTLRLAEEEVSLWSPGDGPCPSSLVMAKDQIIPAQCEGIVMAKLDSPLRVESGLVEPSPQARPPQGIYISRSLVQDRPEVPVRVLNTTHRGQKLARGSPLAHCEPVTLVTPPIWTTARLPRQAPKYRK
jgi:hypothetical protein